MSARTAQWLVIILCVGVPIGAIWILSLKGQINRLGQVVAQAGDLDERERELRSQISALELSQKSTAAELQKERAAIDRMVAERTKSFPWIATAIADFKMMRDMERATELELKSRPALKAAQEVRKIAELRRRAEIDARMYRYQIAYYEYLFPWLTEFKEIEASDLADGNEDRGLTDDADPIARWLAPGELAQLSRVEKFQRALDRYEASPKSNWQVGRDFERFVGYRLEVDGWRVEYRGIVDGFDDLGRDLIASKEKQTRIIQCKRWSVQKLIHEKHIFQIFGTAVKFFLDRERQTNSLGLQLIRGGLKQAGVIPTFVTTTSLSDRARDFAQALGVEVREQISMEQYPMIKCNIALTSGEKIYHLPFDQQYDRVQIKPELGERYAKTVAEAEALGFRRAYRWRSNDGGNA